MINFVGIPPEFQGMVLQGSDLNGIDSNGLASNASGTIFKQCFDWVMTDSMRLTAAAGVYNPGSFELFNVPQGRTATIGNGTTPLAAITKTAYDNNITTPNALPKGWFFCYHTTAISIELPVGLETTPIGTGNTIVPTRGADGSSDNLMSALNQSVNYRFLINTTTLERGPIRTFPSGFGASGSIGSTGTNATPTWGGIYNNGFGLSRGQTFFRHLSELQQFSAFFDNPNLITITRDCSIRVDLIGWMFIPVT